MTINILPVCRAFIMRALAMLFAVSFLMANSSAQKAPVVAHSHNDYLQSRPFLLACEHGFGSVEADIFLHENALLVAHTRAEIQAGSTLEMLYLQPIAKRIQQTGHSLCQGEGKPLQLLIDLKTEYRTTLKKLVEELEPHRAMLFPEGPLKIVISGNTPPPAEFDRYPAYVFFDGRPEVTYTETQLKRIGLISQAFTKYSRWRGSGPIPDEDRQELEQIVKAVHDLEKPVRFWANPDTPLGWKTLTDLGVDYLNTDKIEELSEFLKTEHEGR